jgi:hypothetical protein
MSNTFLAETPIATTAQKPRRLASLLELEKGFTTVQFSLLLALMTILAFPDIIFGSATFVFRDYALFGYPLASYHRECFWRGEIPLWNPLNNSGIPYLAQWNTMVLYPLSAIYLIFPLPWSLGIFCLAHLVLAGTGMFVLARRWTGNPVAAGVAGVAFAFNGMTLSCLIWPNNIAALGWMPWVIYLVDRSWQKGGRILVLASWVGVTQMLAGAPEIFIFTWLILASLWAGRWWKKQVPRFQLAIRAAASVGLITALASAQLFPFLDLLSQSNRSVSYAGLSWSMPAVGWANFFLPLFRCTRTSVGVYLQSGQAWASSYYLGLFVFLLALSAAWRVRKPRVWILAALLAASLVYSLGDAGYIYPALKRLVPMLGFMRFPIKWVVMAAFIVPLLGAFAVARMLSRTPGNRAVLSRTSVMYFTIGLVVVGFLLWFARRFPETTDEVDWGMLVWNGASRVVLLGFLLFLLNCYHRTQKKGLIALLLLAGVYLDGITHAPRQNPGVAPAAYTIQVPLFEEKPKPRHGESRAMLSLAAIEKFHTTIVSNTFDFMLGMRMGLYDNVNLLEGIPKVDGFYSLYLPRETEVRFRMFSSTNTLRAGLADFLGVSRFTSPASVFDWDARLTSLPLVTAGQRPEFLSPSQTLDALTEPGFKPTEVVYLDPAAKDLFKGMQPARTRVTSQAARNHGVDFDVESEKGGLAIIAQAYYPRWSARIDGQKVPLLRANHAFQAVQVPSGSHHVAISYEDWPFRVGVGMTLLTLLGTLYVWFAWKPQPSVVKMFGAHF